MGRSVDVTSIEVTRQAERLLLRERRSPTLHRASSRLRREFFETLLRLQESRLYLRLGFSSIEQYAERFFGYGRTETYDSVRVAAALRKLPRSREAFDHGEISWSALKEITRIAEAETEESWIERAQEVSARRIRAEVDDALRRGRKVPRGKGEGLPEPTFRVAFELRAEEYDLVQKALGKLRWEMAGRIGAELESAQEDTPGAGPAARNGASRLPDGKEALVLMARLVLGSDPAGIPQGRVPREDPLFTVLYHVCPRCDEASLPGPDGPVRIGREVVERVEPEAKRVVAAPGDPRGDGARAGPGPGVGAGSAQHAGSDAEDPPAGRSGLRQPVLPAPSGAPGASHRLPLARGEDGLGERGGLLWDLPRPLPHGVAQDRGASGRGDPFRGGGPRDRGPARGSPRAPREARDPGAPGPAGGDGGGGRDR